MWQMTCYTIISLASDEADQQNQATTLFTDSVRRTVDSKKVVGTLFRDLGKAFRTQEINSKIGICAHVTHHEYGHTLKPRLHYKPQPSLGPALAKIFLARGGLHLYF